MSEPILSCSSITRSYGPLQVLKGIDLSVAAGEIVSITGESGAGKSTLLHILGTLDRPDTGRLYYKGEDLLKLSASRLSAFRNHNLGFVFQFHQLLPEFSALENICLPAWIAGRGRREAEIRAMELLNYLGLSDRAHHKPNQLSGGEQQRAAEDQPLRADDPGHFFPAAGHLLLHTRQGCRKLGVCCL